MEFICKYVDCDVKKDAPDLTTAMRMLEFHKRAVHGKKDDKKEEKKEEKDDKKKAEKRAPVKPPKFMETETREEFKRKQKEFSTYSIRTKLEQEEVADDLYTACDTPLK